MKLKILILILSTTMLSLAPMKSGLKRVGPSVNLKAMYKRSIANALMQKKYFSMEEIDAVVKREISIKNLQTYIEKYKPESLTRKALQLLLKESILKQDETMFEMITLHIEENYIL